MSGSDDSADQQAALAAIRRLEVLALDNARWREWAEIARLFAAGDHYAGLMPMEMVAWVLDPANAAQVKAAGAEARARRP